MKVRVLVTYEDDGGETCVKEYHLSGGLQWIAQRVDSLIDKDECAQNATCVKIKMEGEYTTKDNTR